MSVKQHPHTLEAERQAILDRMQASRDTYRRLLHDEPGVRIGHDTTHEQPQALAYQRPPADVARYSDNRQIARFSGGDGRFPRSAAMRWVTEHPLLCAAAIAAAVVIGPGRIARIAVKGGTAATSLTLRNSPNVDLITRVISMVTDYAQNAGARRS